MQDLDETLLTCCLLPLNALKIWDTAGQERFHALTRAYYRGAHGCLLLYDVTSRESYNHVTRWMADARAQAGPDMVILLAGNKSDLQDQRDITFLEASRLAQENGMLFLETSARTGEGVEEAFILSSKMILSHMEAGKFAPSSTSSGSGIGGNESPDASSCPC